MSDFPVLTLTILVPLVGAVLVAAAPVGDALAKRIGLGFALAATVLPVATWIAFDPDGGQQFTETYSWISVFGAHWALGVDGISLVLVLLTVFLVPVVVAADWRRVDAGRPRRLVAWMLALEALTLVVFTATDVFLFYVVFEAALIPAYFLVAGYGSGGDPSGRTDTGTRSLAVRGMARSEDAARGRAAAKFLLYQLAGGLVMLSRRPSGLRKQ